MSAWISHENELLTREFYAPLLSRDELSGRLPIVSHEPVSSPFPPSDLAEVEFDREVALYLTMGLTGSGMNELEVTEVEKEDQTVYVRVKRASPHGEAPAVEEYPVTIVKVAKEHLPEGNVSFVFLDQNERVLHEETRFIERSFPQ